MGTSVVDDPYKVLGLSPGATQDEIKRAYRRKAKECHPDLHPNDPNAERRMNEVNEAYDMLMNPDKYAQRRAQQQAQQQYSQQQYNPYGQRTYGGYTNQQSYGGQQQSGGYGGWNSDFGFGFEDFFGFGGSSQTVQPPREQPGDSPQIRQVIYDINQRNYQMAVSRLQNIPSTGRNARWYYLSGVANHGAGNTIAATENMQRAVQMDPNNQLYQMLLRQYRQAGQTYETNAHGYNTWAMDPSRLCMNLCLLQMFCSFCRCC